LRTVVFDKTGVGHCTIVTAMNTSTGNISSGGLELFYRSWRPDQPPRGVVAIVPGFNSHSGYYAWVAQRFVDQGIAAYAIDLRGRGESQGERFYVQEFGDYVNDVHEFVTTVRAHEPGLPIYVLGHSAGGVVATLYAAEHQEQLAGLICESFAFKIPAPDFALAVLKGAAHLAPHLHVLTLKNSDFSRNPAAVQAMDDDTLIAHESQPLETLAAMVRADEVLERSFRDITLPVFILHGTEDHATSPRGRQQFFDEAGSLDKTLRFYEGGYHDLLNDTIRDEVAADITTWLNRQLGQRQSAPRASDVIVTTKTEAEQPRL
jgi:alpha-beta hydrolase superfamily lysophospholipase